MKRIFFALVSTSVLLAPLPACAQISTSTLAHLRQGARGAGVEALQRILARDPLLYPEGLITGNFGPLTKQAVMRFQKKNGLDQVGYVGPRTLALLLAISNQAVVATTTPVVPSAPVPPTTPAPTTPPPPPSAPVSTDITAPDMSYISISGLNSSDGTRASLLWSTNEVSTAKVYISTSTPLDISTASIFATSTVGYTHEVEITGLGGRTTYYYVLESADASGNTTRSAENFFQTR